MNELPPSWRPVLARFAGGEISPEIATAQLMLAGADVTLPERLDAAGHRELAAFTAGRRDRLAELAGLVARGIEPENGSLDATRALFDRLADEAPDPAVAIYALNDPDTLRLATDELVGVIEDWAEVAGRRVLDFGCGTGRVSAALRGRAARVLGVDLSGGMVAEARRRHGEDDELSFRELDAAALEGEGPFDLVIAADSWPFLVRAGSAVAARTFGELARALAPSGELLIFNWSYRGDVEQDAAEAGGLAAANGLDVMRLGERPFTIWDGVGFHFRRRR